MNRDFFYGVFLIVVISVAAWLISTIPAVESLSFSPLIVGIILGMIYANTLRSKQPQSWNEGLKFCSKRMLRLGIILFGFRLTFQNVVEVGVPALIVDVIVVSVTLLLGCWIGKRLGMDKETTLMTSAGSAICGAAAVLGVEPIVKGESAKTAVSVSTVVIFGTLSMFLYPILYKTGMLDALSDQQVGIYTGSSLHEVAHVVGAGNAMSSATDLTIASTSLIVKMVRVILLVPVLLIISYMVTKDKSSEGGKSSITIPWFAISFLLMIGVNSLMKGFCEDGASAFSSFYTEAIHIIKIVSTFMLTMAMTALGADTSIDKFKQAGARPFLLAGSLYVWLVVGGYLMARFLVPAIQ